VKKVVVLGATGSVGNAVIDILRENRAYFEVIGLSAYHNVTSLQKLIEEFLPKGVCVVDHTKAKLIKENFPFIPVFSSPEGIIELLDFLSPNIDIIVVAIAGAEGLIPSKEAINKANEKVIIACKEAIVAAGKLLRKYAAERRIKLIPLDSEPIGLLLCLRVYDSSNLEKVYITASGGPIWGKKEIDLNKLTPEEVLKHPVWKMGQKITVDSANFMNKGFEVCEINTLFDIPLDKIKVVVHPEAIVHAIVEGKDNSFLAAMYYPDMRIPANIALFFEEGLEIKSKFSLFKLNLEDKKLSFFSPPKYLHCLNLGYEVAKKSDVYPAILVGADEVAVKRFLSKDLSFSEIPKLLYHVVDKYDMASFKFEEFSWNKVKKAIAWAKEEAYKFKR
jgi:1-deoxy-D-xylulose-5-phosphate reductoisomerase